jgi:hypothetical protein
LKNGHRRRVEASEGIEVFLRACGMNKGEKKEEGVRMKEEYVV